MKRLTVLRHAKSSWAEAGRADFDRPLNKRGWEAARAIGAEMTRRRMHFDLVVASTAARVRETIDGLKEAFHFSCEIRFDQQIYEAGVHDLKALVHGLPDAAGSVLIVGHNPTLQLLLLDLTDRDEAGYRDQVREKYPTGALAAVTLSAEHWAKVTNGGGQIVELILPRDLDD
jgi:phosphohistidine phosphatase